MCSLYFGAIVKICNSAGDTDDFEIAAWAQAQFIRSLRQHIF